ncbi:hypothetical protein [Nocardioides perillae]|uniref:Uncharacterized protein n=1 Tax=Nocardioides perillae TaxID=1119534 RepID=A0A7Y9URI9_9ACTN|nr:hypothetical protein [Nocardioides perillae]NYG54464.1 hypothetical protein [Nocardioides perillae]
MLARSLPVLLGLAAVGVLVLTWVAVGPWGLAALVAVALLPRLRPVWSRLRPHRPWRAGGLGVVAAALVAGGLALLPHAWVPAVPGPGLLVTPAYDGRPAREQPLTGPTAEPGRPDLPLDRSGPVGDLPRTDAAALGRPGRSCAPVATDLRPLVLLCEPDEEGPELALLDPAAGPGPVAWADLGPLVGCAPVAAATSATTVVVVAGTRSLPVRVEGRRLVVGSPVRLASAVSGGDCAVDVQAADGVVWVRTRSGRLVRVPPGARRARVGLDLRPRGGDAVGGGLLATGGGVGSGPGPGSLVVAAHAGRVTAVETTGPGAPRRRWEHDLGGGPGGGPGAPALVDGRWLVVGLGDGPRAAVVALDLRTGREVCRAAVFEDGAGRVSGRPVALPGAALLRNDHPDAADGDGLALLRLPGCEVAWTDGAPSVAPVTVAAATGLAYVVQRAWSPWLVPVTRLAALDPWTGRQAFATRVATGLLGAPVGAGAALGPHAAAYVVVRGGLVRVADREAGGLRAR